MTADLPTLLTPFKRQLAELQGRHARGTLSKDQLEQQTAALERRLLDLLLQDADSPASQGVGRKASGRMLAAVALTILVIAGAGYWSKGMPAMEAQMAADADGAGQPNASQIMAMVEKQAERHKQDPNDVEGWAMLGFLGGTLAIALGWAAVLRLQRRVVRRGDFFVGIEA